MCAWPWQITKSLAENTSLSWDQKSLGKVCDTMRMTFYLSQSMRCHEVSAQNCDIKNSLKTEREERQLNRRLSAHQSATSATQDLNRFSFLCDSQKILPVSTLITKHAWNTFIPRWITIRDMRGTRTYCSSACSLSNAQGNRQLLHTITTMGIWASPSRLTYAAQNSREHHQILDIHALTLPEQSLGESVMAISPSTPQRLRLSEDLEAPLPMECVPEISLCLEPALNRGSLR